MTPHAARGMKSWRLRPSGRDDAPESGSACLPVCISACLCVSGEVSLPAWRPIFDIMLSLSLRSPKKGLSCFSRPDNYFSLIPACQGQSQPSIEARERDHFPSPLFSDSFLFHLFLYLSLCLTHSPLFPLLFFSFFSTPHLPNPSWPVAVSLLLPFFPAGSSRNRFARWWRRQWRRASRSERSVTATGSKHFMRDAGCCLFAATRMTPSWRKCAGPSIRPTSIPRHLQRCLKGCVASVVLFLSCSCESAAEPRVFFFLSLSLFLLWKMWGKCSAVVIGCGSSNCFLCSLLVMFPPIQLIFHQRRLTRDKFQLLQRDPRELDAGVGTASPNQTRLF